MDKVAYPLYLFQRRYPDVQREFVRVPNGVYPLSLFYRPWVTFSALAPCVPRLLDSGACSPLGHSSTGSVSIRILPYYARGARTCKGRCKGLRHGPSATSCQGPVLCMGVHGSVRKALGTWRWARYLVFPFKKKKKKKATQTKQ